MRFARNAGACPPRVVRFRSAANLSASSSTRGPLDDHHPKSAENQSRRRWHRSSILIIGTGFVISAAITRNVYITINEDVRPRIIVRDSKFEEVDCVEQIQHPIIREALKLTGVAGLYLEIVSLSEIGTGMGSSGSFTTALLCALRTLKRDFVLPPDLAEQACHIEVKLLNAPIGKQDQYSAAFGGATRFSVPAG